MSHAILRQKTKRTLIEKKFIYAHIFAAVTHALLKDSDRHVIQVT